MSNWKMLLASVWIVVTSGGVTLADCTDIPGAANWPDGAWLFRTKNGWTAISELSTVVADGRARTVDFAYVARESELKDLRRGILVIKTGTVGMTNVDRVSLIRKDFARKGYKEAEQCESYPPFAGGSVKGRSYDGYHDSSEGVDRSDRDTIRSFHVSYPTRTRGQCKNSNDDTPDSYFALRWRSNRSQFSFDEKIVSDGQYSQFVALFGVTPAYAGTAMSERRVEMKRYIADENGLACVHFSRDIKPGAFIRINDLERRKWLLREPEQSWNWPR